MRPILLWFTFFKHRLLNKSKPRRISVAFRRFLRLKTRTFHNTLFMLKKSLLLFTALLTFQLAQAQLGGLIKKAEIARRTGFPHAEYLSVAFKRQTGQTPRGYRRESRSSVR